MPRGGWRLGCVCAATAIAACFPEVRVAERDAGSIVDTGSAHVDDAGSAADAAIDAGDAGTTAPADASGAADAGDAGGAASRDLALLLHMDEASWSGAGAVRDDSGKGNHGTASGSATTTAGGVSGRAGLFAGGSWVTVPDNPSLQPSTELTVTAWVYPTGLTDGTPSPGIVSKRRAYQVEVAYTLFLWSSNQVWADIDSTRIHSSASLTNGAWRHVALVWNGALPAAERARIYVDGALDSTHATAESALRPNTEPLHVGNLPGGGDSFVGRLDEVAVWTRALSAAEIAALYDATRPR